MDSHTHWKDDQSIYPSAAEIATAPQDCGKEFSVKKKSGNSTKHKFPVVEKLASELHTNIQQKFQPEGLTKNASRGKQPLCREIALSRKHIDTAETDPFFHLHGEDGKVFLIFNQPLHSGIDAAIHHFQEHINQQAHQKNTARTANDGLRLACALLDSKCRASVSGSMTKKRDRKKSDVTGDPITHFFEQTLTECFSDESCNIGLPPSQCHAEFPEEEKGSWDPNHPSIFEHERTGLWLRATWEDHVRPKHKKALDKWNKDTEGGDGTPTSFMDCCAGDGWLLWMFCLDLDANFSLACSAGGRMPKHLQFESGFSEELSSLGEDGSGGSASERSICVAFEQELMEQKKSRKKIADALEKVSSCMESKSTSGEGNDAVENKLQKVAQCSEMMGDERVLGTMSPESKETCIATLQKQRKQLLEKMNEG